MGNATRPEKERAKKRRKRRKTRRIRKAAQDPDQSTSSPLVPIC
jgi:hypothetical protein